MKEALPYLAACVLAVNLTGFFLIGLDKSLARKNARRIRERTLFLCALPFGAPGSLVGMYVFRHKTQKPAFRFGMPALLLLQLAVCAILFFCCL